MERLSMAVGESLMEGVLTVHPSGLAIDVPSKAWTIEPRSGSS